MKIKKVSSKIIYNSSSDESYSNITSENDHDIVNSKVDQRDDDYSYEYSYSSDINLPQFKSSPQKNKVVPIIRQNIRSPNRNVSLSSPKRITVKQRTDSFILDENNKLPQINQKSNDQTSSVITQTKPLQQERKISEISDTINTDISSSIRITVKEKNDYDDNNDNDNDDDDDNDNDNNEQMNNAKNDDDNNDSDINEQMNNAKNDKSEDNDTKYYNSYFCSKMKLKSPVDFSFSQKSTSVLYAKSKGLLASYVYISSNENFSIKEKQYEYIMKITKNKTRFSLRKGEDETDLLIMTFNNDYGNEYGPRKIILDWPFQNLKYFSRIPIKGNSGNWELNFNGKYVLTSQKNAIILDENSNPVIMIRKVQKKTLQIEIIQNIEQIYLFALGIASFICPL